MLQINIIVSSSDLEFSVALLGYLPNMLSCVGALVANALHAHGFIRIDTFFNEFGKIHNF